MNDNLVFTSVTPKLENRFYFLIDQELDSASFLFRVIIFTIFSFFGFKFILSPLNWEYFSGIWHLINLPFHEAGHVFLSFFPPIITSLGGTIGQLLMPLVVLYTLLVKTKDPFGASIGLWWFGESLLDISPYINDAVDGVIPLLGGNFGATSPYGFHDWEFILGELNPSYHCSSIAKVTFISGKIVMVISIFWGGLVLLNHINKTKVTEEARFDK